MLLLAARKAFESKRKAHYNEFFAAKMARKLLEEEDEDENEDENNVGGAEGDVGEEPECGSDCCDSNEECSSSLMTLASNQS